jgi:hypothetical protein
MFGAALATLIVQFVQFSFIFISLRLIVKIHFFSLIFKPTLFASFSVIIYFILNYFIWAYIASGIAVCVYILLLFVGKVFEFKKISRMILNSFSSQSLCLSENTPPLKN